jgi:hypothetical protein
MDSYWDLYVAYVHHCVECNKKYGIDPHHYEMEWNHFLPKAVFGDWPIGHWLTLKQHSIATALQTLALNKCVLCAWHLKHLPDPLLEEVRPIYSKHKSELASSTNRKYKDQQIGFNSPEYINSPEYRETRVSSGLRAAELQLGVHSEKYKNSDKYKEDRDKGRATSRLLKTGIHAPWISTVDGYAGNAGTVALHNKRNGWDPNARIRIS